MINNIVIISTFFKIGNKKRNGIRQELLIKKWPDHLLTLNEKRLSEFIKKYPLSVVDFWAPWRVLCKKIYPRLRRLSTIYKGKVAFGRIDISENKEISKKYNITGIPHLEFFSYGNRLKGMTGVKSINEIKIMIEYLINKDLNRNVNH